MDKCELVAIFDGETKEVPNIQCVVPYDDSFAYIQKQKSRRYPFKLKKRKPLPPSQEAVRAFYSQEKGAINKLVTTMLYRSVLIGTALYFFGDKRSLVRNSLVASGSIEAFLLYWYKVKHKK